LFGSHFFAFVVEQRLEGRTLNLLLFLFLQLLFIALFCFFLPTHHLIEILVIGPHIRRLFHVSVKFLQVKILLILLLLLLAFLSLLNLLLLAFYNFLEPNMNRLMANLFHNLLRIFVDERLFSKLFKSV